MIRSAVKIIAVFTLTGLLAIVVFCCFYLFSDHQHLVKWYIGLNDCFYRKDNWATDFFTPRIKSDGNMYCFIALLIVAMGLYFARKKIKKIQTFNCQYPATRLNFKNILPIILCVMVASVLWQWGDKITSPAYDEVFSAKNVASIQPFQGISYYMLPNNHLLFNALNNLVFHSFPDKVLSGRFISLLVYIILIISLFLSFNGLVQSRPMALLIALTLALQFFVWGFSFQARGYELYLLLQWGYIISLFAYVLSSKEKWLYMNMLCCGLGYFSMPSFLYLHMASAAFMGVYQLLYKTRETAFWKYQIIGVLMAYLLYLPALCFSGVDAIIHNSYVTPMAKTTTAFFQWSLPFEAIYVSHIFSDIHCGNFSFNLVLFILPVCLLFHKKNKLSRLFGMFYLAMWTVVFLMVLVMKRLPFERNLTAQYSITLAGILWLAYQAAGMGPFLKKINVGRVVLFPVVLLLIALHFISTNEFYLKETLYEYDINSRYREISDALALIPSGSSVAFSEESFYCNYICQKKGCQTFSCTSGNEDFYVKKPYESIPPAFTQKYVFVKEANVYEIYKKK